MIVLEARDRVGGRLLNEEIPGGGAIEMGGQCHLRQHPARRRPGVLVGFLEGRHADTAARLDSEARRHRVLADLTAYFGPTAQRPIAYLERDWAAEEYSRGTLHWAGTETATHWPGYMDGAVESGLRTAREVTEALAGAATRARP